MTQWYLKNNISLPDSIVKKWYPEGDSGEENTVLEAIKAANRAGKDLPPLDMLRIEVGSDGWLRRGVDSLIDDSTALETASTVLRDRTVRLAANSDRPPPPPRPEKPY